MNPGTNASKGQTISTQTHQQHFSFVWCGRQSESVI